jgi:hypothetical protein
MVYNIGDTINIIGAGLSSKYLISTLGNPIFPLIAITILLLAVYALLFYFSDYESKWKKFSVLSLVTILSVTAILFTNKYFQNKKDKGYVTGGKSNLPDSSYFMSNDIPKFDGYTPPDAAFADLFDD